MIEVNREELAWAAGFFDGEGSAGVCTGSSGRFYLTLSVGQNNQSTLVRFQKAVLGLGRQYGPYTYKKRPNTKPWYNWKVSTFQSVQAVIAVLWQFLSEPKRFQIKQALTAWKGQSKKKRGRPRSHQTDKSALGRTVRDVAATKTSTADEYACAVLADSAKGVSQSRAVLSPVGKAGENLNG